MTSEKANKEGIQMFSKSHMPHVTLTSKIQGKDLYVELAVV